MTFFVSIQNFDFCLNKKLTLTASVNFSERGNTGIFPNIPLHGFFFMDGCNIKIIEHNMQVRIILASNCL